MKTILTTSSLIISLGVCSATYAAPLYVERSKAEREVSAWFNSAYQAELQPYKTTFPAQEFGIGVGCPQEIDVSNSKGIENLSFSLSGQGEWAGDLDGINTTIASESLGKRGMGLLIPSNSTATIDNDPQIQIDFGSIPESSEETAAADRRFSRCYDALPVGPVSRAQIDRCLEIARYPKNKDVGQQCYVSHNAVLRPTQAQDTFAVSFHVSMMCNRTGATAEAAASNRGYINCVNSEYRGVAVKLANRVSPRVMRARKSRCAGNFKQGVCFRR